MFVSADYPPIKVDRKKQRNPIARAAWERSGAGAHKTGKEYQRNSCEHCGRRLTHDYCSYCDDLDNSLEDYTDVVEE